MTSLAGDEQILKTDTMGRVRTPRARREALLDEFERSGMSGVQFAGLAGVKYQTFAAWVNQRRKQVAARSTMRRSRSVAVSDHGLVWRRTWSEPRFSRTS